MYNENNDMDTKFVVLKDSKDSKEIVMNSAAEFLGCPTVRGIQAAPAWAT